VPTGGTSGQALVKNSGTDYDTVWATPTTYTDEQVRDTAAAFIDYGQGIDIFHDDDADSLTIKKDLNVVANTSTSFTPVLSYAEQFITMDNASAMTFTVPPNSSVAYPVGTTLEGAQIGAGQVTIVPGSGVTVNGAPGLKVAAQYGVFGLRKIATNTWIAYGRLSA
jgi:hypothetical protein